METELMKTNQLTSFSDLPKSYSKLCETFLPRPIHDRVGYENTVEVADKLAGFEDLMTAGQNDYFDLLCDLIEKYETQQIPPTNLKAGELLRHLAEENQLSGVAIARALGKSDQLARLILRGKRSITAEHAINLGKYFGIRPDAFLA